MKDLIDIQQLSVEDIDGLIKTALDIIDDPEKYAEKCKRKKLATLFYEPSTRTRLSFESAMLELGGSILPGITRNSVIRLAKDFGIKVEERKLALEEVVEALEADKLEEAFGTGTAAVISPVGELYFGEERHVINGGKMGELSSKLYDVITGIQYGELEDPYGWRVDL